MSTLVFPARRPDLIVRPFGTQGGYVVKNPRTGEYFHLGEEAHFLLAQLDGPQSAVDLDAAFQERFGTSLTDEELHEFFDLLTAQGLGQTGEARGPQLAGFPSPIPRRQSLVFWRKTIFDPDRVLSRLEPKLRFFWSAGFLCVSACAIVLAAGLVWANRDEFSQSLVQAMRWQTLLLVVLTLLVVGLLHDLAHGITCTHYGGEVHEIGFLLLFFMPCFYCNVSDSWLFREKSKRLWVMFAGGYFELFLWALAVFVWRLTVPGSVINYIAFVILTLCGIQTLFNFNPLLKLDGYYLLSDWLEIPNLQERSSAYVKGHGRRLLWGAAPPAPDPRARALVVYGLASWLYAAVFLSLMLWALVHIFTVRWGWLGLGLVSFLAVIGFRGLLRDTCAGEVRTMLLKRHKRTFVWLLILGSIAAVLCFVPMEDRAGGTFLVRSAVQREVRAPTSGFVQEVFTDEGSWVSSGTLIVRLQIPDLAARVAQKQAEIGEAQARLRLLERGPRPEELTEQQARVDRAAAWHTRAQDDLTRGQKILHEELERLDQQIAQYEAEVDAGRDSTERARGLRDKRAVAEEEYRAIERTLRVSLALWAQAKADKRVRQAKGVQDAETELARRAKELADAQAVYRLLKLGSRAEEIDAERARLARLRHEASYLEQLGDKACVRSCLSGVITTPRLKEKVGQFVREGDLLCVIEETGGLEVEVCVLEQEMERVRPGQEVSLKARMMPYDAISARVERIAPAAVKTDGQSVVTIYCRLDAPTIPLYPGATGYARIYSGPRPIGAVLLDRVMRFVRTEFWW